jgi:hypothetical protein
MPLSRFFASVAVAIEANFASVAVSHRGKHGVCRHVRPFHGPICLYTLIYLGEL